MRARIVLIVLAGALAALGAPAFAGAKIKVVASIPDMAAITRAIGGDAVEVESIVKGNRDVHSVELLPSLILKVQRADIYVKVGLDLDLWAQGLIDGSRNAKLQIVDAALRITPLEVPTSTVDRSQGDIHRLGNPHYWLDPANARPIAETIRDALTRVAPDRAAEFTAATEAYAARMEQALAGWKKRLAPLAGTPLVSHHSSWPYFAARFDLRFVAFLEPKPGIPPTPAHIAELQKLLNQGQARAILMETYFDDRTPTMLSRTTGAPLIKAPVLVGAEPGVDDQFKLFETIVGRLEAVLKTKTP